MPIESVPIRSAAELSEEDREDLLRGIPPIAARLKLLLFRGLSVRNPFLHAQLDRTRRRLLGLNRLERHALRAGFWKDEKHRTRDQMRSKIESWLADPTRLIETLDGRLTWIEGASEEAIAREAAQAPPVLAKMDCVLDLASQKLPVGSWGIQDISRSMIEAFCGIVACHSPSHADRIEQVKQRLLAMGMARRMAMKAAFWHDTKHKTLEEMSALLETWFSAPQARLDDLEQRLTAAEALSSQGVEEQLATLPRVFIELEGILEAGQGARERTAV